MTVCIYHGNCADGFGAAWVVNRALKDVSFYAGVYQNPPPDVEGRDVVMVDFSYKRPVMLEMAKKARSILIIDHHKSAIEDLVDLPVNVITIFDLDHSGAILTWMHYFPDATPPGLLSHIEDRDLWRFKLSGTREILAALFSYPYAFDVWDELMSQPIRQLIEEGKAIERKHHKDVDELVRVSKRWMVIGGHSVPVANLPYTLSSDAGVLMAQGEPFAACYMDTPDGRVFSLRSTDRGEDVSNVAKMYGGGGHRNAAGFRVSFQQARAMEDESFAM